jgi:hypothetical protein
LVWKADENSVGKRFPLNLVTAQHAIRFRKRYQLPIEEAVFVRGVLALRSQDLIESKFKRFARERSRDANEWHEAIQLRLGDHEYTKLETEVMYNAWTWGKIETLRNFSLLHRLLVVDCIYAAMTQQVHADSASFTDIDDIPGVGIKLLWPVHYLLGSRNVQADAFPGAAIEVMKDLGKSTLTGLSSGTTKCENDPNFDIDINHNTWLLGITVGVPFFAGAVLGLIISDPIIRILRFGRRGAICVAGIFSFISVVGSASVHKWEHLLGFRILLGAGMAGKASIVPILLSETSPKNVRGILLVLWQLFVAFGLAAGSVANLSVYRLNVHLSATVWALGYMTQVPSHLSLTPG